MKFEIEIKLRLPNKLAKIRQALHDLGFQISKHRVLESNTLFDNSKRALRRHGKLIRVRSTGNHSVLTYKGPSQPGKYKKRQEIEIGLPEQNPLGEILTHIGYHPVFRYEKFRTEYARSSNGGKVMLDETPIGNFLEIEGSPRWIDQTARRLGLELRLHHAQLRLFVPGILPRAQNPSERYAVYRKKAQTRAQKRE